MRNTSTCNYHILCQDNEMDPLHKLGKTTEADDKTLLIPKQSNASFIYVLTFFAVLGGFMFGYDTGIISGSMLLIRPYFHLDYLWTSAIVSGTVASAAVTSLVAGFMSDCLGRKVVIMLSSLVFGLGAVVMGIANSPTVLLVGRIVVGVGVGFASMTVPVYIAEAAPPDMRGRLVTLNQMFITIGILVSSLIAGAFSDMKDTGWRYMLGLGGVPAVIQFFGMIYLPESPRWLMDQDLEATARACLMKIRGTDDVDAEVRSIKDAITLEKKLNNDDERPVIIRVWCTPHVRKAVIIGCMLQFFQQFCGINTVIYYSASILKMGGMSVNMAIWIVAVPNAINFLATFIGYFLVDRAGRKILLLVSFVGVFISVSVMASGFLLASLNSPPLHIYENISSGCNTTSYQSCYNCIRDLDCGYCYSSSLDGSCLPYDSDEDDRSLNGRCNNSDESNSNFTFAYDYCPNDYAWMLIIGMGMFVFSFAPGLGPMPGTINSEIYPMWARSTGCSLATATNWASNLIVTFTFLSLTQAITKYGTFWLFGGMCILGFIFTIVFLPETKNKTLEEIDLLFKSSDQKSNKGEAKGTPARPGGPTTDPGPSNNNSTKNSETGF